MAKNKKGNVQQDFPLISPKVRVRVANLIEKKLTSQTVMLFAQKYENYDIEFRKQLIDYINHLMQIERETLLLESKNAIESSDVSFTKLKEVLFEQRQKEIKKFQEYLIRDRIVNKKNIFPAINRPVIPVPEIRKPVFQSPIKAKKTFDTKAFEWPNEKLIKLLDSKTIVESKPKVEVKTVVQPKPKFQPKPEINVIDKMLEEAKIRERKEARELKILEAKSLEEKKQRVILEQEAKEKRKKEIEELAKIKEEKKIAKKLEKKVIPVIEPVVRDRNYEKEQAEKEKLWKELYGKTRHESLTERNNSSQTKDSNTVHDKKPNFEEQVESLAIFTILEYTFTYEEILDPLNKYYPFWSGMKKKYKTMNILVFISTHPSKQKNILNKRLKYQSKSGFWNKLRIFFSSNSKKLEKNQENVN